MRRAAMCESRRRLKTSTFREGRAVRVQRKPRFVGVIDAFSDLFIPRGVPEQIRSGTGPEFLAKAVQNWIAAGAQPRRPISRAAAPRPRPGERLNRELRRPAPEEIFYPLGEAKHYVNLACNKLVISAIRMTI